MKYTCTGRERDKNNNIIGYLLISDMGLHTTMKADELKEGMKAGTITVTNLKLTSNNRIISTGVSASKVNTAVFKRKAEWYKQRLANIIKTKGKAPDKLYGYTITKVYNMSNQEFYILSLSDSVHILIIPDNLDHVILGNCDTPLRRIRGSLYVVGGKNLVSTSTLFGQCQFDNVDITAMETQKLEEAEHMFAGSKIGKVKANKLNTPMLRSIKGMFSGSTIKNIDLVIIRQRYTNGCKELDYVNMENMFSGCKAHNVKFSINITSDAIATDMFNCSEIDNLDIRGIDTNKISRKDRMFSNSKIGKTK